MKTPFVWLDVVREKLNWILWVIENLPFPPLELILSILCFFSSSSLSHNLHQVCLNWSPFSLDWSCFCPYNAVGGWLSSFCSFDWTCFGFWFSSIPLLYPAIPVPFPHNHHFRSLMHFPFHSTDRVFAGTMQLDVDFLLLVPVLLVELLVFYLPRFPCFVLQLTNVNVWDAKHALSESRYIAIWRLIHFFLFLFCLNLWGFVARISCSVLHIWCMHV